MMSCGTQNHQRKNLNNYHTCMYYVRPPIDTSQHLLTASHNSHIGHSVRVRGQSWSWSYGSWSYNYLCNLCWSPLKVMSSNPTHDKMDSIQNYAIKFVSAFLLVSATNKTDRHDIIEVLLKVALNTITYTPLFRVKSRISIVRWYAHSALLTTSVNKSSPSPASSVQHKYNYYVKSLSGCCEIIRHKWYIYKM